MPHAVTLIPGDGTGPEIAEATRRVLEATGVQFTWDVCQAGAETLEKYGTVLPDEVIESIKRTGVGLKGPITTPVGKGQRSANVALRKKLDLYANLRPAKTYHGLRSRYENIDLIIVRENTEDLYAGIEFQQTMPEYEELIELVGRTTGHQLDPNSAMSIKYISVLASRRIVKFAFDYARANGRRKVTAVHKANIMRLSDGLFLSTAHEVAREYPDIHYEDRIVDNMCMQLVQKPELYDVLVLPNLYGDIISDLSAGLIGGLGVAPGANIGSQYAVFEPVHGSAPKYAGLNKVNPMAMMFSGVMMLRHLGEREAAQHLELALTQVLAEGRSLTYDLKLRPDDPTAVGTSQVADAVIDHLQRLM
ncbi:isocitrate/isopropylmalate dehydrogenase family protein [Tengunoibacter tsumagoiensis]|uniref:Isocitrate dehydrogenase n=1 Tax=Tengunoibacter tsumagoiensis TaxID=2014871 RepID=A0A402A1X8_9CHLR|nr:isocitrate/isopropylmalate dehydrogenase family protein [Tengunoibacter tsumagoiensis]GCE13157.1 isocitrate dehydrogenase [Tengunoibacter tsumagoiensis]